MAEGQDSKTGVYQWRNLVNGKVYVGSASWSFARRLTSHRQALRRRQHKNLHLQAAWNKYGEEAFAFEVLEHCDPEDCIAREQHWIDSLDAANRSVGYNQSPTAGSTRGAKLSAETRAKMSASRMGHQHCLGRKLSAAHIAAIVRANKGRKHTPEAIEAIRAAHVGMKASAETRAKLSASHKGRKQTPEHRANISAALKGRVPSAEHRAKLSAAMKIRIFTAETRAKMSASAKRRKAREKIYRQACLFQDSLEDE